MPDKKEEKQKAAALEKLQNILAQINDCKNRGVAPPVGLIAAAEHLADLFPDPSLIKLLKEIQAAEKDLVEKVVQAMSSSSWMDTKSFKELIAIDPFKAAELYFEREEIKKLNSTIDKIEKGELPSVEEFTVYLKVLSGEKENRDLLCPALAVEVEKLKQQAVSPETLANPIAAENLERAEEHLANLGKHKVHAAVHNKHRERRRSQGLDHSDEAIAREDIQKIVTEVLDVNILLEKVEVFTKDIAALPEEFILTFIKTRNTAELKTQVETQRAADIQAAKELIERELAETAQRDRRAKEKEIKSAEIEQNTRGIESNIENLDKLSGTSATAKKKKILKPPRGALVRNSAQKTVGVTPAVARKKSSDLPDL